MRSNATVGVLFLFWGFVLEKSPDDKYLGFGVQPQKLFLTETCTPRLPWHHCPIESGGLRSSRFGGWPRSSGALCVRDQRNSPMLVCSWIDPISCRVLRNTTIPVGHQPYRKPRSGQRLHREQLSCIHATRPPPFQCHTDCRKAIVSVHRRATSNTGCNAHVLWVSIHVCSG